MPDMRVCVCGCTGEWVRAKERLVHTDVKTVAAARTAAPTRRPDERTERAKERMASGLRAWRSQQQHLQETASQPGSKASITQCGGDMTRLSRMTATLARRPTTTDDMNPLGFVPDLSMRGVGIIRLKETTFMARLQPVQGCALATDTPPPMAATILWSASPGH
jgi:hypothetical protein